jgi:hypothetical protein
MKHLKLALNKALKWPLEGSKHTIQKLIENLTHLFYNPSTWEHVITVT